MEWHRRGMRTPQRLGILAGTFNPPTAAHLGLARAALAEVDETLLALPRTFPHKPYSGASFEERVAMLLKACALDNSICIASPAGGLFAEIAEECRREYGPSVRLSFICGSDAARRIVEWDYGTPGAVEWMLEGFDLLVASRGGAYRPPAHLAGRIRPLALDGALEEVSATGIRERIQAGLPWEHLVPPAIVEDVRRIYSGLRKFSRPSQD